jgi:hypothetical protein
MAMRATLPGPTTRPSPWANSISNHAAHRNYRCAARYSNSCVDLFVQREHLDKPPSGWHQPACPTARHEKRLQYRRSLYPNAWRSLPAGGWVEIRPSQPLSWKSFQVEHREHLLVRLVVGCELPVNGVNEVNWCYLKALMGMGTTCCVMSALLHSSCPEVLIHVAYMFELVTKS